MNVNNRVNHAPLDLDLGGLNVISTSLAGLYRNGDEIQQRIVCVKAKNAPGQGQDPLRCARRQMDTATLPSDTMSQYISHTRETKNLQLSFLPAIRPKHNT